MKISYTPLDMLSPPNVFSEMGQWNVSQGTPEVLWLRLQISDQLGTRRYVPAAGATLKMVFMRARTSVIGTVDTAQTFEVTGTLLSDDRSIWSCSLTATQVNTLMSGTVKVVLTVGTTTYTMNKAYAIKKTLTSSGC